jgi:hypothetical protein
MNRYARKPRIALWFNFRLLIISPLTEGVASAPIPGFMAIFPQLQGFGGANRIAGENEQYKRISPGPVFSMLCFFPFGI